MLCGDCTLLTFCAFDDYVKQPAIRERQYNSFPMRLLN